jgi:DNA polymerase III subunit epsilon
MPSMNVKLRLSKDLCAWQLKPDASGLHRPTLITHKHLQPGSQDNLYGLFYNKKEALANLTAVAKKYQLCAALLGLEKVDEGQSCFGYQVKKCQGACIGLVSPAVHSLKLQTALALYKVPVWPYEGAVAIKDGHHMLVINKWCYLGTAKDADELADIAQSNELEFDLDIYKIVKKAIVGSHKTNVVKLPSRQSGSDSYDAA